MSGGDGGFRVSIPNNLRKTIHSMKEITGNHADDEIYAMLKECSMDPNEAIHKLLFQDPFHEVKRKRDRKKEVQNSINKDPTSRWTPNIYGRGNRVDRTDHSPRHIAHDTGGGRPALVKEEAKPKLADNTNSATQERKIKADALIGSSVDVSSNDSTETTSGDALASDIVGTEVKSPVSHKIDQAWKSQQLYEADTIDKNSENAFGSSNVQSKPVSTSSNDSASSAVCVSASDPVLVPSDDALHHAVVSAIKLEAGSQRSVDLTETKTCTASEVAHSLMQEPANPQGIHKSQANESQSSSSSSSSLILSGSTGCRPSSNYNNRSQQADGSPNAPNKEWKPKQMNINLPSGTWTPSAAESTTLSSEVNAHKQPSKGVLNREEKVSTLQMKFEYLLVNERKNVIIPNHIHVPESERFGLSFGSIDAGFGIGVRNPSGISCDKSSVSLPETSHGGKESAGEQRLSDQNRTAHVEETEYNGRPQLPICVSENISSGDFNFSSDASPEFNDASDASPEFNDAPETSMPHGGEQYSVIQQPLNPANYDAHFYRSGTDSDVHVPPLVLRGVGAKYNGNSQTSQSQQEGVLSNPTPVSLVSQAGGVMQALPQQSLPIFHPPTGMRLSHYQPNYFPYGHYFSPYYLPGPPAIHQFLGNGVFPQQPPPSDSLYPTPAPPAAGIKYQFLQSKAAGNSCHIGLPSGYVPYNSSPATGNPNNNEDLPDSQFKEGNTCMTGQQSEATAVWVAGPSPGISNLPASSFYNLPPHPQGQHVAFTPTQTAHGAYTNLYHHPGQAATGPSMHPLLQQSQTMSGAPDMVAPTGNIYQQSPHPQANWLNNY